MTSGERQLFLIAAGISLDEKIEKAIANFREYEREALRRDPERGYYLCDSYGKDSCVIRDLAKRSGVRFQAHHNITTLDPPELIRFGRKYHADTTEHRPRVAMLTRLVENNIGPPTRLARWCCREYKESMGNDAIKVLGIRAAESNARKTAWRTWTLHSKTDSWILNPILYWTDVDVWQYIHGHSLPYCSLYDEGWSRLGCIGCPMAGKKRREQFARWPKYEQAWQRAFERFWAKWHRVPRRDGRPRSFDKRGWTSWRDMWSWWMEEDGASDDDDTCQGMLF